MLQVKYFFGDQIDAADQLNHYLFHTKIQDISEILLIHEVTLYQDSLYSHYTLIHNIRSSIKEENTDGNKKLNL